MNQKIKQSRFQKDLLGLNQLSNDGILNAIDLVESLHQQILTLGGMLARNTKDRTSGITGWVYRILRKSVELSKQGIDLSVRTFTPLLPETTTHKHRHLWVSILNGLVGDHLHETNNPLALSMALRHQGKKVSIAEAADIIQKTDGNPLLMLHGLCMSDRLWKYKGHDHGRELQNSQNMVPIYIRYNTGLPIHENGALLNQLLEQLTEMVSVQKQINVLCHSMGGLVLRSALHQAESNQGQWHQSINKIAFLGTPHQGALLEKTGSIIDQLIRSTPYSAPFARIGNLRSQGIKDLRHGNITIQHQTLQIPSHIKCYAIAASTHDKEHETHQKWIGDGLVSVSSALGHHKDPTKTIHIPKQQQFVIKQVSHLELLSDSQVFQHLNMIYSKA